jgi:hypothetical protein
MSDTGWLFLYTPIPYLAALYFAAYRHDLGRIAKPFHDGSSLWEWHLVCDRLKLLGAGAVAPKKATLGDVRNRILVLVSLVLYAGSAFASFLLPWYYLCAIQAGVAVPLFLLFVLNRAGPLPFKPYRDVLPYPRLGARVRDLGDWKKPEPGQSKPAVSTAGGKQ